MGIRLATRHLLGLAGLALVGCSGSPGAAEQRVIWAVSLWDRPLGEEIHEIRRAPGGSWSLTARRTLQVRVGGEDLALATRLEVEGDVLGHVLSARSEAGDDRRMWTFETPGPLVLEYAEGALAQARAGTPATLDVFLPVAGEVEPVSLRPGDDAGTVEATGASGTARLGVAEDGRVQWLDDGVIRIEQVEVPVGAVGPVDLDALFTRPSDPQPGARAARHVTLRFSGVAAERLERPPVQTVVDGVLTVRTPLRFEIPAASYTTLETLVAGVQGALDVAVSPGRPSALAALRAGRGDCNEHAALLVARARAEGLDARPVTGMVYTDDPPAFRPHAWAEVRLPDPVGWVPVDPVFGQAIADATHVALWPDPRGPAGDVATLRDIALRAIEVR